MVDDIGTVFRDFNNINDPASGEYEPEKPRIRGLLRSIRNSSGLAITRNTLAALTAVTPATEDYMGIVLDDPDPSNNGYYSRVAAAWVWERGFPDTFARVTLGGTTNAQTGSVAAGVDPASTEVFFATVGTDNTGPMTLSVDGETARDVVNAAGNALSAGEWTGVVLFFLNENGDYQLLIDAGAAAAAAASASAADADRIAAELARNQAQAAASSVSPTEFPTIADAEALTPISAPDFIRTAGYTTAGDGGGALYRLVVSEPGHAGKFSITLDDAVTVVWYEIAETVVNPKRFAGVGDGVADDRTAIASADGMGLPIELVDGTYLVNSNITIANEVIPLGGILKPANGVTITLTQTPRDSMLQIFDCSLGGSIVLSRQVARPEWFSTSLDLSQSFDDWHAAVGEKGDVRFAQRAYTQSAVMSLIYAQNWEGEGNKRNVSITATGNFKNLENSTSGVTAITHMQLRRIIFIADATRNGVMLDMADMVFLTIEDCGIVGSALAGNIGIDLYGTDNARSPIHARIVGNIISNCGASSLRLRNFANSARILLNRIQPGASGAWGIDLLPTTGNYLDNCTIFGNTIERGGALLNLTNGIRLSAASPNDGDADAYIGGNNRFEGLNVAISVGVNGKIVNDAMGENFFGSCTQDLSNSTGGQVPPGIRSSIRFLVSGGAIASTTFSQNCTVARTGVGRFTITHTEDMGVLMPQVTVEFNTSAAPYGVNVIGNTATSTTIVTWTGDPNAAADPTAVDFIAFGYR